MTTPVWIRLWNFPIHLWLPNTLKAIGNSLGNFIKVDEDRIWKHMFTSARICIALDLSYEIPNNIILKWRNQSLYQPLDYENTAL